MIQKRSRIGYTGFCHQTHLKIGWKPVRNIEFQTIGKSRLEFESGREGPVVGSSAESLVRALGHIHTSRIPISTRSIPLPREMRIGVYYRPALELRLVVEVIVIGKRSGYRFLWRAFFRNTRACIRRSIAPGARCCGAESQETCHTGNESQLFSHSQKDLSET